MKRKKKLDKMVYAESYYNKHAAEIDKLFGDKKNFLDSVKYNIRQDYYYSAKNARLDIQDHITVKKGGDAELAYAKRNATNKELYFPDSRKLNGKIKPSSAKLSTAKWTDIFGFDVKVEKYYEIKDSNLVLANIITSEPGGKSPVETWEYLDKNYV